jgi:hypothetical protein
MMPATSAAESASRDCARASSTFSARSAVALLFVSMASRWLRIEQYLYESGRRSKCCIISSCAVLFVHLPFGSTKMSGNAREGLHETLLDMTEQKTLLMSGVFSA